MERKDFIRSGRRRYRRFYRMVALATAICVAVTTGSLVVGDSVRRSLQLRVVDRLYGTRSVVVAGDGFLSAEALDLLSKGEGSRAVLLMDGFISREGRLIPVTVWGMDVLPDGSSVSDGGIFFNSELAGTLDIAEDPSVVLRLPGEGLVPSSSLFVTSRYSTSLRLEYSGSIDAAHGGNLNLRNSQTIPYNVFVSRKELCVTLGLGDKINVILSPDDIHGSDLSRLTPSAFGMRFEDGRIVSDRVFIKGDVVDKLTATAENPDRLFSYLVNSIEARGGSIPYSFATAIDSWKDARPDADEAIVSDYAARRLGLRIGDSVRVSYYVSGGLKNLTERTSTFVVSSVVPISELKADGALSADFPGLSDAENCSSWDSDLPIDMDRISVEDERFWDAYGPTPKILLPYATMRDEWSGSWGGATQVRTTSPPGILDILDAEDFQVSVIQPFDAAMANASSGVDFGGLFLALGCFIIITALLLLYGPLGEMYAARRGEFSLLSALGYPGSCISSLLMREVLPVAAMGAAAGILAAVLYAGGVIFLLGNIWSGATHTDGFVLYPQPLTLAVGLLSGLVPATLVIALAIRNATPSKTRVSHTEHNGRLAAIISSALLAVSLAYGVISGPSVVVFVFAGCLCLASGILWIRRYAVRGDSSGMGSDSIARQSVRHSLPEYITGLATLALGVFITFAVGLNRQDYATGKASRAGTGGFDLWCELTVPLQHDISTPAGRSAMSLSGLGDDASVLQLTLVGGDDASCLNLNRITTPAILGFRPREFLSGNFRIKDNVFSLPTEEEVLERMAGGDAIYGLVDETVLMWSLMKSVGDTLHYNGPSGRPVDVVIAGTLPNTVLQGYVLIPEDELERHWPDRGSRLILVKSSNPDAGRLMEIALNEYGIRVTPSTERMRLLGSVTDTYLTIFLMLGAIGLILGAVSFVLGTRKRLATKETEIRLLRALGFPDRRITGLLFRENAPLPAAALLLGLLSAAVSVSVSLGAIPGWIWAVCILTTSICLAIILLSVRSMAASAVTNTPDDEDNDN